MNRPRTTLAQAARFWDRAAASYARDPIRDLPGYQRTLERTGALLGPDDRVLELGCGTGTTALQLAHRPRAYLATDLSPAMIALADAKLRAAPCPALRFRQATAETLAAAAEAAAGAPGTGGDDQPADGNESDDSSEGSEAGGGGYDAVLAFNLLHLVPDLPATLAQIRRLTRPGGLFVSKTPCLVEMTALIRLAVPLLRLIGKAPPVLIFSAATLERAVADAGFEVLAVERHASAPAHKDPRPYLIARRPASPQGAPMIGENG